ncbi:MAG: DNA-binding protein [Erysipelotrichaceae bacterium]|nr:DNA-binding protein [Erysipelotrichaceae bacterium]
MKGVKELAFRLKRGDDLKKGIVSHLSENDTAVILSAVGCLSHLKIRLAKALDYLDTEEDYEIISMIGTVSKGNAHLHIGVSDDKGNCVGGHLMDGCIINTTCEVVLGILEEYDSCREFDEETGYDEISFIRR